MANEIRVDLRSVQRRIQGLQSLVNNPHPLMREIAATLHALTDENFDTEGDGTWPALKHREGKPLQDTRRLYNSITESSTDNSATLGTNVIYAALQQFGAKQGQFGRNRKNTPIPWGDVPARPYFPIDENGNITTTALERVMETLEQAAQNALR